MKESAPERWRSPGFAIKLLVKQYLEQFAVQFGTMQAFRSKLMAVINKIAPSFIANLVLIDDICKLGLGSVSASQPPSNELYGTIAQNVTLFFSITAHHHDRIVMVIDSIDQVDEL
jgi:hypothetical protein